MSRTLLETRKTRCIISFYSLHITFHIPQNKHCSYIGAHNYHVSSYDDLVKLRFYSIGSHYQHDLQKALFGFFRNTWHTFYRTWGKSKKEPFANRADNAN